MPTTFEKERQLQGEIAPRVEHGLPGVDVLAVEVVRTSCGQIGSTRERDMTQEIIEAVREIERDKGIEEGALVAALEDALLAAYKKTPGASRHATVEMDDHTGDFRVFSVALPRARE